MRDERLRAKGQVMRWAWMGIGFVLITIGLVGVFIPFTFHILGALIVIGLIMVLRNSRAWRRRFVRFQRKHPRWGVPLRRLLRKKPEVAPVFWHETLRTERWLLPRSWRRLVGWRRRFLRRRRAPA